MNHNDVKFLLEVTIHFVWIFGFYFFGRSIVRINDQYKDKPIKGFDRFQFFYIPIVLTALAISSFIWSVVNVNGFKYWVIVTPSTLISLMGTIIAVYKHNKRNRYQ